MNNSKTSKLPNAEMPSAPSIHECDDNNNDQQAQSKWSIKINDDMLSELIKACQPSTQRGNFEKNCSPFIRPAAETFK
eukprot:scaffold356962_cov33-Prasinocladus_malaysianus.AAC.1